MKPRIWASHGYFIKIAVNEPSQDLSKTYEFPQQLPRLGVKKDPTNIELEDC